MTMFTTFTEQFRKQDITLFSDFIGDAAPFGITSTGTTALSGAAFSSTNISSVSADQPLGTVALTLTSTTNAVAGIYPAIGIYPSAAIAAGGNVNRDFRVGRGEIDLEVRLFAAGASAAAITTVGIGEPIDAASGKPVGTEFVGFYAYGDETYWTACIVTGSTIRRSVVTTVLRTSWNVLRVVLDEQGDRAKCYANGRLVATFDGQLSKTAGILPHAEIRNRGQTPAAGETFTADYMMLRLKANR